MAAICRRLGGDRLPEEGDGTATVQTSPLCAKYDDEAKQPCCVRAGAVELEMIARCPGAITRLLQHSEYQQSTRDLQLRVAIRR